MLRQNLTLLRNNFSAYVAGPGAPREKVQAHSTKPNATDFLERRLAAILVADVEGYSAHMGDDEVSTLKALRSSHTIFSDHISRHFGRIVNVAGDSILAEFRSAAHALEAAISVQNAIADADRDGVLDRHLRFRIGLHVGDILETDGHIYGDGVNVAARLQALVNSGQICLSSAAYNLVRKVIAADYRYLGNCSVKNIADPIQAYLIETASQTSLPACEQPVSPPVTLAVLPFTNMSGDPDQEYFADGMVEDLITALSRTKWLYVISRTSSSVYKGKSVDVRKVGRELNVRYAIEGSVRKLRRNVRITAQLIDALTGGHIWAGHFDGEIDDIFALQDVLVDRIVAQIEPNVRALEIAKSKRKPTADLDAYDLYLRAQSDLISTDREACLASATLLREALLLDPSYSDAWASLAECTYRQTLNGWISDYDSGRAEAYRASQKAVHYGPDNGPALAVAAWVCAHHGKGPQSLELAERALAAHPNSATVLSYTAVVLMLNGQIERSLGQLNLVRRLNILDPRSFMTSSQIAQAHFFMKNFESSIEWGRRVIDEVRLYPVAYRYLAGALAHAGRLDEARKVILELLQIQPNSCLTRSRQQNFPLSWMTELYIGGLQMAGLPESTSAA